MLSSNVLSQVFIVKCYSLGTLFLFALPAFLKVLAVDLRSVAGFISVLLFFAFMDVLELYDLVFPGFFYLFILCFTCCVFVCIYTIRFACYLLIPFSGCSFYGFVHIH